MPVVYEIYGRNGCTFCEQAKELAKRKGLLYKYHNIEVEPEALKRFKQLFPGAKTVPQIARKDDHGFIEKIGGYTDLVAVLA